MRPILEARARVRLAFCPERLAEGRAIQEFRNIPVVVGGVDAESTRAAAEFWERSLGVPVIRVADARTAEMVKLADNLWIDLNIALANELAKLSDRLDIDVLEMIDAANTLPKGRHHVNILTPSVGVGGYCLTKDPWFVHGMGAQLGIELKTPATSRNVNDSMPGYSAGLIDGLIHDGVPGRASWPCSGSRSTTPATAATRPPRASSTRCAPRRRSACYDPGSATKSPTPWRAAPFARPRRAYTLRRAHFVSMFHYGPSEFPEIPIEELARLAGPRALIFDGRMICRDKLERMRCAGLRYKGVGR